MMLSDIKNKIEYVFGVNSCTRVYVQNLCQLSKPTIVAIQWDI